MNRRKRILALCALFLLASVVAGSPRHEVKQGNQAAGTGNPDQALLHYKRALEQHGDTAVVLYDVGNVLQESGQFDPAFQAYMGSLSAGQKPSEQSETLYNAGNSLFASQKYDSAVAAYVESLKRNPSDEQAKYNLELARRMLRQQQQQQQQQQNQQDSEPQQQKQEQKEQQQENEDQNEQQEQPQQPQQQEEEQEQQQQAAQQQMTPEEAERLLNALLQNEQEALKEARKVQVATKAKREKDW